jgi:hypothetical protein
MNVVEYVAATVQIYKSVITDLHLQENNYD